ncbi:Uncharacterized protein DAT39_015138 [Clarias magur]|uniref:Uncharacterized protein n=1 Tax=Clarias magur TaxID=1594786 RepID=A0A8J4TVL7_CLAMG|nr:Uncharacterized protein DAT39_015138 [Clarias magur]
MVLASEQTERGEETTTKPQAYVDEQYPELHLRLHQLGSNTDPDTVSALIFSDLSGAVARKSAYT